MNINYVMDIFTPTEDEIFLHELARSYYIRCELYDRTVCSAMKNGEAVPVNSREMVLIGRFATTVMKDCIRQLHARDLSYMDWKPFKKSYVCSQQHLDDIKDL